MGRTCDTASFVIILLSTSTRPTMQYQLFQNKEYFEQAIKYFGLNNMTLQCELELLDSDTDRAFTVPDFISRSQLEKLLREGQFPIKGEDYTRVLTILVISLNLMHKRYQEALREYDQNQQEYDDECLVNSIRKDVMMLFELFSGDGKMGEVTVSVNGKRRILANDSEWLSHYLRNRLFPVVIPDVKTVDDARKLSGGKRGRKELSKEEKCIIDGLARFFADEKMITGSTPKPLLTFITQSLVLTGYRADGDPYNNESTIKARIQYVRRCDKDARLPSRTLTPVSLDEMAINPIEEVVRWIYTDK